MGERGSKYLLVLAIVLTTVCIFQIYATLRYIRRLPDDTLGIVLYIVTSVLFGALATAYYFRWIGEKKSKSSDE